MLLYHPRVTGFEKVDDALHKLEKADGAIELLTPEVDPFVPHGIAVILQVLPFEPTITISPPKLQQSNYPRSSIYVAMSGAGISGPIG